jgi:multimeric flavodoxin WrbA
MERAVLSREVAMKILVAYHSIGGNTEKVAQALAEGAGSIEGAEVLLKKAVDATVDDFRSADAFAFGTPDYFSYMAGMLKDMFDRVFYEVKGDTEGKPCVCFVTHGGGGKAVDSMERICNSFKLDCIVGTLSIEAPIAEEHLAAARELGKKLAGKFK